ASHNSSAAYHVADSNPASEWSSVDDSDKWIRVQFLKRARKVVEIKLEGEVWPGWSVSVSLNGTNWTPVEQSAPIELRRGNAHLRKKIPNPSYYFHYSLNFSGSVKLTKVELLERQTVVNDLVWPIDRLQAVPKLYVDNALESVELRLRRGLGFKSYTGYIPPLATRQNYRERGFNVASSGAFETSDNWGYIVSNSEWASRNEPNSYIEVQLPESIQIWKFGLKGTKAVGSEIIKNQPKSFILKGSNNKRDFKNIFSTENAGLVPGVMKYFEVASTEKFSVYRVHINSATYGSTVLIVSGFQLYPILDIIAT
ncbi:hypothetical protein BOX15_Mlig019720g3, partial [Macrostomum lignano]